MGCFIALGVGEYKDKAGLVYRDGTILLPCIFNYIENHAWPTAQYNGVEFSIHFSDEPLEEDGNPRSRSYQVSDGFFVRVACLGLADEVHDHPAMIAWHRKCSPSWTGISFYRSRPHHPASGSGKSRYFFIGDLHPRLYALGNTGPYFHIWGCSMAGRYPV